MRWLSEKSEVQNSVDLVLHARHEPQALHMQGECSTTELHSQPQTSFKLTVSMFIAPQSHRHINLDNTVLNLSGER